MISTIICSLIVTLYGFTYLKNIKDYHYKDAKTILNVSHSSLMSLGCFLHLNDIISVNTILLNYYLIVGFFIFDIYYILHYNIKNELLIKSIHHIISIIGVYALVYDHSIGYIMSKLYLTEIVNIPLEVRYVCIRYNTNKHYYKDIAQVFIYILFLITRIIYPIPDFIYVCKEKPWFYCADYIFIYSLWCYWFIIINSKLYKKIKSYYLK